MTDVVPVALITGGSRGVGAATALALAERGFDVALTYRNKAARAEAVVAAITRLGQRGLAVAADMTDPAATTAALATVHAWAGDGLTLLVLNASGGLERDRLATDPSYPLRLNRDAQVTWAEHTLPLLTPGGMVVFVTSHWAHRYGAVVQLPAYEAVAASKHAGEQALRGLEDRFAARGVRLVVVTGDLIEGTITAKLLERTAPGLAAGRDATGGRRTTTEEMGEAIAQAATDAGLASGTTVVIGGALDSLPPATISAS